MGKRAPHLLGAPVVVEHPHYPGQLVLVREPRKNNTMNFPGGGVDFDYETGESETLFECAIREAKEEAGIDVELTGIVGLHQILENQQLHMAFTAKVIGGTILETPPHPLVQAADLDAIIDLGQKGLLRSPRVLHYAREYYADRIVPLNFLQVLHSDPFGAVVPPSSS